MENPKWPLLTSESKQERNKLWGRESMTNNISIANVQHFNLILIIFKANNFFWVNIIPYLLTLITDQSKDVIYISLWRVSLRFLGDTA